MSEWTPANLEQALLEINGELKEAQQEWAKNYIEYRKLYRAHYLIESQVWEERKGRPEHELKHAAYLKCFDTNARIYEVETLMKLNEKIITVLERRLSAVQSAAKQAALSYENTR